MVLGANYREQTQYKLVVQELAHEAIKRGSRGVTGNEDKAVVWTKKGASLRKRGLHKNALRCYEKALKLDPSYAEACLGAALSSDELGKLREAVSAYEQFLLIAPLGSLKEESLLWLHVLWRLHALGYDTTRIVSDIYGMDGVVRRASESEGQPCSFEARAWEAKARCFSCLGRHEDAVKCYDEVLKIDSRFSPFWVGKGTSLQSLGHYEEALGCFERALEIDPLNRAALNNKIDCLDKLGR